MTSGARRRIVERLNHARPAAAARSRERAIGVTVAAYQRASAPSGCDRGSRGPSRSRHPGVVAAAAPAIASTAEAPPASALAARSASALLPLRVLARRQRPRSVAPVQVRRELEGAPPSAMARLCGGRNSPEPQRLPRRPAADRARRPARHAPTLRGPGLPREHDRVPLSAWRRRVSARWPVSFGLRTRDVGDRADDVPASDACASPRLSSRASARSAAARAAQVHLRNRSTAATS